MTKKHSHSKKYFLFFLVLTLLQSFQSEQTRNSDSTTGMLLKTENSDEKVVELLLLAKKSASSDPEKALALIGLADKISDETGYFKGKMDVLYEYANTFKNQGNIDSALFFNQKFTHFSDSLNDTRNLAKGYAQFANLISRKGEKDLAYSYLRTSEKYFMALSDTSGLIGVYNSIGNYFENTTFLDSAAFYYLKTIKLCENNKNEKAIGSVLTNLGKVYIRLSNFPLAIQYVTQSIGINTQYGNLSNVALAYTLLGNIANEKNKTEEAIVNYGKAETIYKQLKNSIGLNNLYINYGEIYRKLEKDSLALLNFDLALKYSKLSRYMSGIIASTKNKAAILIEQNKYSEATSLLDTCLFYSLKTKDKESRKDVYFYFSTIYSKLGNYKKAFWFLNKYSDLKDSIDIKDTEAKIAGLTMKFEKEKDQARILTLENENLSKDLSIRKRTNQRNAYMFSGSGLILLVVFIAGYFRNKAKHESLLTEQRIRQMEEEKKLWSARLLVEGQEEERKRIAKEMHDGIGVLLATAKMQFSSIQDVNPDATLHIAKATKLLEQATSDVRKITHNMMPGLLTKFGFFDAVEDLIEKIDDAGTITAKVKIAGDTFRFQENKEIMLYRIIQEFVHNTIKHANASIISVNFEIDQPNLIMSFSDNGCGFDVSEVLNKQSIGLTSIMSRVSFLDGKITIDSSPGEGTTYKIEVCLN